MRRKHKTKIEKKPVFAPFDNTAEQRMIPFDEEFQCVQDTSKEDINNMALEDLEVLQDSLVEDIADYDTIIDIQLDTTKTCIGFDSESLKMDRQRRQRCIVELRKVRDRIKMLKYGNKEVAIAV